MSVLKVAGLFLLAAVCEVGGAYLVWQWLRLDKPATFAVAGIVALTFYAIIQTAQPFSFGRAFAGYGGVFIVTALIWGWLIDGRRPDRWDAFGVGICLLGVALMLWMPRS